MSEFRLGDRIDESTEFVNTPPPVVFKTQPTGYVRLKSPEELRAWEEAVRLTTGLEIVADSLAGHVCESGCEVDLTSRSDMCDLA
ncbi:hypothetical protein ACFQ6B_03560 [Streptomyces wedmorensis]|uniref:Uncharacterized protein n=2 Tax=Streptomyces TaxID=1883 RepID=A0A0L8JJZ3_STRVR|nr:MULTISPECIES: hypothetical protein [Streptomyces]KOG13982.1 hypothetical protein ADK34_29895 [Streptomyces viridochromogenes]